MVFRCRRSIVHLALLGGFALSVSACGQKGPLYLTDDAGQRTESTGRTTDAALKSGTYGRSLFPEPRR